MTWMQIGKAKSGNSWLYSIMRGILKMKGRWGSGFIEHHPMYEKAQNWDLSLDYQAEVDVLDITEEGFYFRISSAYRESVEDLPKYVDRARIIWTHSPYCDRTSEVSDLIDKAVYICRDPRDVALSTARFVMTPYMKKYYPNPYESPEEWLSVQYKMMLRGWVKHIGGYMLHTDGLDIHWVFYERLKDHFETEIASLCEYLGVDMTSEDISKIKKITSLKKMKYKNPNHVQKGQKYRWTDQLSEAQIGMAKEITGPLLDILNYPVRANEADSTLPRFPVNAPKSAVQVAIDSALPSLLDRAKYRINRLWIS